MKKILFPILFAAAALAACDDDVTRDPSPVTPEDCQNVYFPAANEGSAVVSPTATEYPLTIRRDVSAEEADVPIHVSTVFPQCFDIPATVHFAAGAKEAELKIGLTDKMEFFVDYALSLQVDKAYADYYTQTNKGSAVFNLTLAKSDWKLAAEGVYTSNLFNQPWRQTMEHSEILGQYRLPDCYAPGYPLIFTWDGGNAFKPVGPTNSGFIQVAAGFYDEEGTQPMYLMAPPSCPYNAASKTFGISGGLWYIPGVGQMGAVETFVVSKFYE